MDTPQDNRGKEVLTQFSDEISDLSNESKVIKDATRNELTLPNGSKVVTGKPRFETLPWTPSSSPSFTSPGSFSTKTDVDSKTLITQPDLVEQIVSPPVAKRQLAFTKENDNPQPRKKPKEQGIKQCLMDEFNS